MQTQTKHSEAEWNTPILCWLLFGLWLDSAGPGLLGIALLCSCWKCPSEGKEMVANHCGWSHNLLI